MHNELRNLPGLGASLSTGPSISICQFENRKPARTATRPYQTDWEARAAPSAELFVVAEDEGATSVCRLFPARLSNPEAFPQEALSRVAIATMVVGQWEALDPAPEALVAAAAFVVLGEELALSLRPGDLALLELASRQAAALASFPNPVQRESKVMFHPENLALSNPSHPPLPRAIVLALPSR